MSIFHSREDWHDQKEIELLEEQVRLLRHILHLLTQAHPRLFPIRGIFTQGDNTMITGTIKGLLPGTTDTFFVTPVDINGNADQLPAGSPIPTITADDPTVTVTTAADGLSAQVTAASGAVPGSTFNLSWAASYLDQSGNTVNISARASVPILKPPVLLPVGGVFSQGAPAA